MYTTLKMQRIIFLASFMMAEVSPELAFPAHAGA